MAPRSLPLLLATLAFIPLLPVAAQPYTVDIDVEFPTPLFSSQIVQSAFVYPTDASVASCATAAPSLYLLDNLCTGLGFNVSAAKANFSAATVTAWSYASAINYFNDRPSGAANTLSATTGYTCGGLDAADVPQFSTSFSCSGPLTNVYPSNLSSLALTQISFTPVVAPVSVLYVRSYGASGCTASSLFDRRFLPIGACFVGAGPVGQWQRVVVNSAAGTAHLETYSDHCSSSATLIATLGFGTGASQPVETPLSNVCNSGYNLVPLLYSTSTDAYFLKAQVVSVVAPTASPTNFPTSPPTNKTTIVNNNSTKNSSGNQTAANKTSPPTFAPTVPLDPGTAAGVTVGVLAIVFVVVSAWVAFIPSVY